jgi:hypothetical protein
MAKDKAKSKEAPEGEAAEAFPGRRQDVRSCVGAEAVV